jgi:site-specific recombinase XerC
MPSYAPSMIRLHRVVAVWLATLAPDEYYRRSAVLRLCEVLGSDEVIDLDTSHIAKYVAHRRRQGAVPAAIQMELGVLSKLLDWCRRNRIVGERTSDVVQRYRHLEKTNADRERSAGSA